MATLDASQDYLIWDNLEAVTVTSRRNAGNVPRAVAQVKRRAPTFRELAASNGAYTGQDLVWLVPDVLLNPNGAERVELKPGDVVSPAGSSTWTVLEAAFQAWKSVWRLVTRNLVLAYDLRDLIEIQRATVTYDAARGEVRTWPDGSPAGGSKLYEALPAKVQLVTQTAAEAMGLYGFTGGYAVWVGQQVDVLATDRVKWNGIYLDIRGLRNPQRIDELPVLDCERLP